MNNSILWVVDLVALVFGIIFFGIGVDFNKRWAGILGLILCFAGFCGLMVLWWITLAECGGDGGVFVQ
jgi:hypothetical protein